MHAKLPELGNGEIMYEQDGTLSIRFSSGHRAFKTDLVIRHLEVTSEAPAPAPKKRSTRARKVPVAKPAAKAAAVSD
jgi:hypothetical protein